MVVVVLVVVVLVVVVLVAVAKDSSPITVALTIWRKNMGMITSLRAIGKCVGGRALEMLYTRVLN